MQADDLTGGDSAFVRDAVQVGAVLATVAHGNFHQAPGAGDPGHAL